MSLILYLIQLAIDEVMKIKNFQSGKSIDLQKTTEAVLKMQEAEKNFHESIEEEITKFQNHRESIQSLFDDRILPQDSQIIFEIFMQDWNEHNKATYAKIKKTNQITQSIISSAERLHENAMKMLSLTFNSIDEMSNEKQGNTGRTALPDILRKASQILPVVLDYIRKFNSSIDTSLLSTFADEQKFVNERFASLNSLANDLNDLETKISTSISPFLELMRKAKVKEIPKDEDSEISLALKAERERKDQELMSLLRSPQYLLNLNAPKESVMCQRISLMEDVNIKQNNPNETALYRVPRVSFVKRVIRQALPENNSNFLKPPSRSIFGKINTKDILERATSRVSRNAHNSTRFLGAVVPRIITPKMSSTMLSCHQDHELFNCTGISEIRSISPLVESPPVGDETPYKTAIGGGIMETPVLKSDELHGISPRRQLIQQFNNQQNDGKLVTSNHETTLTEAQAESVNGSNDKTISNETAIDATFAAFRIKNDEDLLDISDSILNEVDM